jgi:D-glycero-D-manno-heptose 1,7-bisphosphate phosphatase
VAVKKRAVFLDRDGTINEDVGYPRRYSQIKIYPQSFRAVSRFNQAGLMTIVITNQSGIGRGLLTEEALKEIHRKMLASFAEKKARLDAFYYCPHYDLSSVPRYRDLCSCRKPNPGLALRAATDFDIDLPHSYMVGDKVEDILFGRNIQATPVLVLTGSGQESLAKLKDLGFEPAHVAEDILQAAEWIIAREKTTASS